MRTRTWPGPVLVVGLTAVVAVAAVTWFVADIVYDTGLPRCGTGRRVVSCGPAPGWHEPSIWISSLLGPLLPLVLVGVYLGVSARDVRRRRPARREARRRDLRRRCGLAVLAAVATTVPLVLLVRSALPA